MLLILTAYVLIFRLCCAVGSGWIGIPVHHPAGDLWLTLCPKLCCKSSHASYAVFSIVVNYAFVTHYCTRVLLHHTPYFVLP